MSYFIEICKNPVTAVWIVKNFPLLLPWLACRNKPLLVFRHVWCIKSWLNVSMMDQSINAWAFSWQRASRSLPWQQNARSNVMLIMMKPSSLYNESCLLCLAPNIPFNFDTNCAISSKYTKPLQFFFNEHSLLITIFFLAAPFFGLFPYHFVQDASLVWS